MEFSANPTDEQAAEIGRGLDGHNADVGVVRTVIQVRGVYLESGRVVGGIEAAAYWGKLHIRTLWVHEDYRSMGLGSRLMDWAEERGRELECVSAVVNTMSFQAPEFYVRAGYSRFGVSEGYEGEASRHYFEKAL